MTTNIPNLTINVGELLNTEKLSEETTKLFRSFLGFNEPTVSEEGEKLTAESEQSEPTEYEEAIRLLKAAEKEVKQSYSDGTVKANAYISIADRYIKLGGY